MSAFRRTNGSGANGGASGANAHRANGHGAARGARANGSAAPRLEKPRPPFALYVEGPRDVGLLEAWAQRVSPALAERLAEVAVILGGCRPARAAEHFRELLDRDADARGLVVLDRDAEGAPRPRTVEEPGLAYFTWGRRHIESYLLVPGAIRRSLRLSDDDTRVDRFFRDALPSEETSLGAIDAKPLFAVQGELHRLLGRPVHPVQVARSMFAGEIHADVRALLGLVRTGVGHDNA